MEFPVYRRVGQAERCRIAWAMLKQAEAEERLQSDRDDCENVRRVRSVVLREWAKRIGANEYYEEDDL